MLNRLSVADGKIVLPDGMRYSLLVVGPGQSMDLEVLRKIEALVKAGMTVIAPRPEETTGLKGFPGGDAELSAIADRLWGKIDGKTVTENQFGKGRVIWGEDVNDVLNGMGVKPDLSFSSPDQETALDYIHRSTEHTEIYFVTNWYSRKGINDFKYRYLTDLPDRYEQVECKLRVSGKIPQYWNPQTGEMKPVPVYSETEGQTVIPMHLGPEGSVFIVFTEGPQENPLVRIERDGQPLFPGNQTPAGERPLFKFEVAGGKCQMVTGKTGSYSFHWADGKTQTLKLTDEISSIPISDDWTVHFDPAWGGPKTVVFKELRSWTTMADERIKYYSGSAVYEKTFTFKQRNLKRKKVVLDLGNLHEIAVVTLNGHRFDLCWAAPYQLDVTGYLRSGANTLKIEITNLWPNRLIGDRNLPLDKRLTKTNVNKFDADNADDLMRESGLLGPVSLQISTPLILR